MQTVLRCGLMVCLVVASSPLRAQVAGGVSGVAGMPAQQPVVETSTGSVTGVVIAQDTQRPVRFAQVQLVSIAPSSRGGFGGQVVRTDVDGEFVARRVSVGDYYVMAAAPGYIPEAALLRAQVLAGGDPAALLAAVPQVRVTTDGSNNVTVTLQRGGVIAGHVEWEDGSPATGINVNAAATAATAAQMPEAMRGFPTFGVAGGTQLVQTDDRGNFRVTGLPTGEYLVSATVLADSQSDGGGRFAGFLSPIRVYAPRAFRKSEAKVISVRAGDERTDIRILIDPRSLHTVSGHATSANPGEQVAAGGVRLTDNADNSFQLQAQIDADGGFKLRYAPPGTYTLRISNANSQAPVYSRGGRGRGQDNSEPQPKGVAFQDFSTTITVTDTDVTGVAVSLVPKPSQ